MIMQQESGRPSAPKIGHGLVKRGASRSLSSRTIRDEGFDLGGAAEVERAASMQEGSEEGSDDEEDEGGEEQLTQRTFSNIKGRPDWRP